MSRNRTLIATLAVAGLLGLAVASTAQARSVGGPHFGYGERVNAHGTTYYYVDFYAGELAQVGLIGDGDTDLDLYVYDENGNLIASDTAYGDVCYCEWVPLWTGTFRIEVVNLGSVYNIFDIETN